MADEHINKKEKVLIENIISEHTLLPKIFHILKPHFFSPPLDRVVSFVNSYFEKYYAPPSFRDIEAETDVSLEDQGALSESDCQYTLDEIESHCQQEAIKKAILDSVNDVEKNNISSIESRIREAISIKIDNDLGIEYFDLDPNIRISEFNEETDPKSTGYKSVDDLINNVNRGDLIIFAGSSGAGKSVMLSNVANNFSIQKENVLIISLELNQSLTASRLDSIITGISRHEIFEEGDTIRDTLDIIKDERGSISIKYMPFGTTPPEIRSYLLEYQLQKGYSPDVLVLDYIDEMKTGTSQDYSIHDREGATTAEVRQICQDWGMRGVTASQLTKNADDLSKLGRGEVSGSALKIARCDACVGLFSNEDDIDNNQIQLAQIKVRNGSKVTENKTLYINPENMRISEDQIEATVKGNNVLERIKKKQNKSSSDDDNDVENQNRKRLEDYIKTL